MQCLSRREMRPPLASPETFWVGAQLPWCHICSVAGSWTHCRRSHRGTQPHRHVADGDGRDALPVCRQAGYVSEVVQVPQDAGTVLGAAHQEAEGDRGRQASDSLCVSVQGLGVESRAVGYVTQTHTHPQVPGGLGYPLHCCSLLGPSEKVEMQSESGTPKSMCVLGVCPRPCQASGIRHSSSWGEAGCHPSTTAQPESCRLPVLGNSPALVWHPEATHSTATRSGC